MEIDFMEFESKNMLLKTVTKEDINEIARMYEELNAIIRKRQKTVNFKKINLSCFTSLTISSDKRDMQHNA